MRKHVVIIMLAIIILSALTLYASAVLQVGKLAEASTSSSASSVVTTASSTTTSSNPKVFEEVRPPGLKYVKRAGPGNVLLGKKIAIVVGYEFEDIELLYPFLRLSEEGAEIIIVALKAGLHPRPALGPGAASIKPVTGRYGTPIPMEVFEEGLRYVVVDDLKKVKLDDIDAIIFPGGFSPDHLRVVKEVLDFTREAYMKGKIIAAICHGPQVLISAGLVTGKVVTSYAAVWDDLRNAGAKLLDVPAVIDGRIVTGRVPDDLPEFVRAIIEALTGKEYVSALR